MKQWYLKLVVNCNSLIRLSLGVFQLADLLADSGLRAMKGGARAGEAATFSHGNKGFQVFRIKGYFHKILLCIE